MKKIFTLAAMAMTAGLVLAENTNPVITLDLSKSTTPLDFNAENGAWVDTFDEEETAIESQCFSFVHSAMEEYKTWWGFTASNSADNQRKEDTITFQYSNMAKGGIALNEDGTVKVDEFGAPVTSSEMPYLVAYYSPGMAKRPMVMGFNDEKNYEAIGMYVNLNSYAYYCIENGDSYARAFTNGDNFTLTIHGVAPDETEKEITVSLASYTNGNLTINRGWSYIDLSALGVVNEIYFTMTSTDSGAWGNNTPSYFCLDKMMVKEASESSVNKVAANRTSISYDRTSKVVKVEGADFMQIYTTTGNLVKSTEESSLSISDLSAGIYVVKAGDSVKKIVR